MDFSFSKDQELIRKSIREFFIRESPKAKVRELKDNSKGFDHKTWKRMVALGYLGLIIPERYGGTEGGFLDLMVFQEELGRNIVPCPFFTTAVLCSLPLVAFGSEHQKKSHLPRIAQKGEIWSFAQDEHQADKQAADVQLNASKQDDGFVLNGIKTFVPYGNAAKMLLVAARTKSDGGPEDGITLFIVPAATPGISHEVIPTTARDMRCQVTFENVAVSPDAILGDLHKGWDIIDFIQQRSAVLKAAEMSGGVQAVLDIILKYARTRKQFKKPIGSFQAIQHRLVDLHSEADSLKNLVYEASWRIGIGNASRILNSMVKAKANQVYHQTCHQSIVMHGAIGWTEEMDIGLYHIKTRALIADGGHTDLHLENIATELEKSIPDFRKIYGYSTMSS
ncbi:acyl-CoA/acyl-ACP dehydrogenase [bacterium]|nr:acyl-CoA/acyl-ACP dehydrogenase [bacterium]